MSRGLGDTQRAVLGALAPQGESLTLGEIAGLIGRSENATKKAVHGLRARGLVETRVVGWWDSGPQRALAVVLADSRRATRWSVSGPDREIVTPVRVA